MVLFVEPEFVTRDFRQGVTEAHAFLTHHLHLPPPLTSQEKEMTRLLTPCTFLLTLLAIASRTNTKEYFSPLFLVAHYI